MITNAARTSALARIPLPYTFSFSPAEARVVSPPYRPRWRAAHRLGLEPRKPQGHQRPPCLPLVR